MRQVIEAGVRDVHAGPEGTGGAPAKHARDPGEHQDDLQGKDAQHHWPQLETLRLIRLQHLYLY